MQEFILSGIFTVSLGVCYIPQIAQTIKTKNVEGINLSFWIILALGLLCNTLLLIDTHASLTAIVPQAINLVCAIIMIVLVRKYRVVQIPDTNSSRNI